MQNIYPWDSDLVIKLVDGLETYMNMMRQNPRPENPENCYPFGETRKSHICQIQERLEFLQFLLENSNSKIVSEQANRIWNTLIENTIFENDRDLGFQWFTGLLRKDSQDMQG